MGQLVHLGWTPCGAYT